MQMINSRIEANKPKLTVTQMMYIGMKGFGHLTSMAGTIFLIASFFYLAVGSATLLHLAAGLLFIAAGHHIQQLSDKLEERHVLDAQYLDLEIRQLTTRLLTISVIAALILFI